MPTLTVNEADVLAVIREQCRNGDPVATGFIKDRLLGQVPYDAVDRALRGLLAMNLVTKTARGWWLPKTALTRTQGPRGGT